MAAWTWRRHARSSVRCAGCSMIRQVAWHCQCLHFKVVPAMNVHKHPSAQTGHVRSTLHIDLQFAKESPVATARPSPHPHPTPPHPNPTHSPCQLQGWVSGTGGGISIRASDGRIVMAPSGVQKERMVPSDMFILDAAGDVLEAPTARPPPYKAPKLSECSPLFMSVSGWHGNQKPCLNCTLFQMCFAHTTRRLPPHHCIIRAGSIRCCS